MNIRIFFQKNDSVKFISHLDMNRTFIRAIRRSGLPIMYTEGFSPHPYMVFTPPLSVGYISNTEILDIGLTENLDFLKIIEILNKALPIGFRVSKIVYPVKKISEIFYSKYEIKYSDINIKNDDIERLKKLDRIEVEKQSKSGSVLTDITDIIKNSSYHISENNLAITTTLPSNSENNINPRLITEALKIYSGFTFSSVDYKRIKLFDKNLNDFE